MKAADARWVYRRLFKHHGPQHWWPGDTPFEVMVGAVLTQNTSWRNVERAIDNLKQADALSAEAIVAASADTLAAWLRPSGYFNLKARRLKSFCEWYLAQGGYARIKRRRTAPLRKALLAVKGIGPETADDILLYAFGRAVFVIDAYTRRLFERLGLVEAGATYEDLRMTFEQVLGADADLFNEYHALIVIHGKDYCRPKPRCGVCCLARRCPSAQA